MTDQRRLSELAGPGSIYFLDGGMGHGLDALSGNFGVDDHFLHAGRQTKIEARRPDVSFLLVHLVHVGEGGVCRASFWIDPSRMDPEAMGDAVVFFALGGVEDFEFFQIWKPGQPFDDFVGSRKPIRVKMNSRFLWYLAFAGDCLILRHGPPRDGQDQRGDRREKKLAGEVSDPRQFANGGSQEWGRQWLSIDALIQWVESAGRHQLPIAQGSQLRPTQAPAAVALLRGFVVAKPALQIAKHGYSPLIPVA